TSSQSMHAFPRTKATADDGAAPSSGFSAMVDSNTDAATASRDDGPRQSTDQQASATNDNAAPPPSRANANNNSPSSQSAAQQSERTSTSQDDASTTDTATAPDGAKGDKSATQAVTYVTGPIVAEATDPAGKSDKADAKSGDAEDSASQAVPIDQAATII